MRERSNGEAGLRRKNAELRVQLKEAQETLDAIRNGEVDALVVGGKNGDRVYTLESAESAYRVLVESMNEGAATLVDDGTILYCNVRFAELLKKPLRTLIGSSLRRWVAPRDLAGFGKLMARGKREFSRGEVTLRCEDGSSVQVQLSSSALDIQGHAGVCLVVTDLSERKRAEEALRRAHDELEERVRERTAALNRIKEQLELRVAERTAQLQDYRDHLEELVKARTVALESANDHLRTEVASRQSAEHKLLQMADELKRSNQELEQFAYVASHDLQEPLRAIGGYVGLLEHRFPGMLNEKAREYVREAVNGVNRMGQQISDLLALSRVGTRGLTLSRVNLAVPLKAALRNLQFSLRAAKATVKHEPLPTLRVDSGQITQLFQNLIGNALKFCGNRRPLIRITAKTQGGKCIVSVRDNGIGIGEQYFQRIFNVFQRLHTRRHYSGTGIGLAICKRIVERHGGAIWVESKLSRGSTFYFTIPEREG